MASYTHFIAKKSNTYINSNCSVTNSQNPFKWQPGWFDRKSKLTFQNKTSGVALTSWRDSDCIHQLVLYS